MRLLGIETSCDETSVAVVSDGRRVESNAIGSSRDSFAKLGGVIPEAAARRQIELMNPMLHLALEEANCTMDSIDAIAVTSGPGLYGSLLVGTTTARMLAELWQKPLIGVHHTLGHLTSTWLAKDAKDTDPVFPILTLSASGGHTDLWYRTNHISGQLLGRTRDDAAGEAFDKGAALLGLSYPGGPAIAAASAGGDESFIELPVPRLESDSFDFSFSGLKTALKYALRDTPDWLASLRDIAASYQAAICIQLCDRIKRALSAHPETKEVHLVGGVSANLRLRELVTETLSGTLVRWPAQLSYCTDNAAMIAAAAFYMQQQNEELASFLTDASAPLADVLRAV